MFRLGPLIDIAGPSFPYGVRVEERHLVLDGSVISCLAAWTGADRFVWRCHGADASEVMPFGEVFDGFGNFGGQGAELVVDPGFEAAQVGSWWGRSL